MRQCGKRRNSRWKRRNKILIADDSEINRSLLADMLSKEYDLLEAGNGLEAMAHLNRYHHDISLVLLDIVMPKMDGFEVLSAMNKNKWIDDVPVIIISAETSSTYIDHAYDLGAVEYINSSHLMKRPYSGVSKISIMLYAKQKLLQNMVMEQMLEKRKTAVSWWIFSAILWNFVMGKAAYMSCIFAS